MTTTYFTRQRNALMVETQQSGVRALCYDQQAALLESMLVPGMTVLDVGCGPSLSYRSGLTYLIGLDASADALRVNTDVDERLHASATAIPLPGASVDLVVAFYMLHHLSWIDVASSRRRAGYALAEMERVVRPGGRVLVFEVTPWAPVWWAERLLWNTAKTLLGARLDACFWPSSLFTERGYARRDFACSPWAVFPPVLALPWLRMPRFLFPFTPTLYHWRRPYATDAS